MVDDCAALTPVGVMKYHPWHDIIQFQIVYSHDCLVIPRHQTLQTGQEHDLRTIHCHCILQRNGATRMKAQTYPDFDHLPLRAIDDNTT
jgi:hypothetical protein